MMISIMERSSSFAVDLFFLIWVNKMSSLHASNVIELLTNGIWHESSNKTLKGETHSCGYINYGPTLLKFQLFYIHWVFRCILNAKIFNYLLKTQYCHYDWLLLCLVGVSVNLSFWGLRVRKWRIITKTRYDWKVCY